MTEKVVGYLLLASGVIIILLAALSVYMVFTAKSQPASFIKPGPVVLDLQLPADPAGEMTVNVPLDVSKIMPVAPLTNIFIHLMLMGFIASIGARLAGIGVNLVRPIIIKAKESSS
jgi:hypothetical protein